MRASLEYLHTMEKRCRREIDALHEFFEGWFNGRIDNSEAEFSRFEGALAPDFTMVTPGAELVQRAALLASLRAAHGSRSARERFRILIQATAGRALSAELAHFTYEEWHESADGQRGRLSSVLFEADASAPGGVRWLFVHETWLPQLQRGGTALSSEA
jgi:hypothetical protein